ncbi:hypothetical protein SBA3_2230011 [Candidatus Sulfopaludibacter sp. SbA3]|nr:hypothetical protein SBA3_2230011 [Candidatus Sulfopaludibacter sp. SbA3]
MKNSLCATGGFDVPVADVKLYPDRS